MDQVMEPPAEPSPMPRSLTAAELATADLPERRTILDPILSTKSLALLYGPRGSGKTFLALGIAWAAATGGSFLGWQAARPRRVVYVDGEMAAVEMRERLALFGAMPDTLTFLLADLNPGGMGIADLGRVENQIALSRQWGAWPDLLVLDNLASLVGTDRNGADCWAAVQAFLLHLRREGVAVLVVHHANKSGRQRGPSQREDMLDLVLALRPPADYQPRDGARFEIHFEKARGLHGDAVMPIEARLETDTNGLARWSRRPVQDGELGRVAALLKGGLNPNQVARELGISKSKSYRLRERIIATGACRLATGSSRSADVPFVPVQLAGQRTI
jgi:putative DNA primase/helicase